MKRKRDGDGGPAVQAQLDSPYSVAADGAGNVYIADVRNHRIRKVDATGTITTFAGGGEEGFSGRGTMRGGGKGNGFRIGSRARQGGTGGRR